MEQDNNRYNDIMGPLCARFDALCKRRVKDMGLVND